MSLRNRINKLEQQQPDREPLLFRDEEAYVSWCADNPALFDHEPDFPVALALAQETVNRARLSTDPPWIDPNLEAGVPIPLSHNLRVLRLRLYRRHWFPEAHKAVGWLEEMDHRRNHGIPPVSEAEYAELAAWLEANAERLDRIADGNRPELIDVGKIGDDWYATKVRSWMVRYGLKDGPRCEGAGKDAETIRRLRSMYPEESP